MCTIYIDIFLLSTPRNEDADGAHTKDSLMDDTAHGRTTRINCWTTQLLLVSNSQNSICINLLNYFLLYYVSGHDSMVFISILIVCVSSLHVFAIDVYN